jgi:hypothetical protein
MKSRYKHMTFIGVDFRSFVASRLVCEDKSAIRMTINAAFPSLLGVKKRRV